MQLPVTAVPAPRTGRAVHWSTSPWEVVGPDFNAQELAAHV